MTTTGHLSVYDLILTTRSPLHIGSGSSCAKTDYLFDPRTETVSMIDPEKLFECLYRRRLADRYERAVLSGDFRLDWFLRDCGITGRELDDLCLYRVDVGDALDDTHRLKEIRSFMRDSRYRAYIPGSSVKGALRTVILAGLMAKEKKGSWPDDTRKTGKVRQMQNLEGQYLNTLSLKRNRSGYTENDPVNSILRGLSVSDSEPISDEDLILVGKIDANEKGEYKKLPLCRECVRPGVRLRFKLTVDHSALPADFSVDALMRMIKEFDAFYQKTYVARFAPPRDARSVSCQDSLVLGGGSGFFAKTLAYPYLGVQKGMQYTENVMVESFRRHGHDKDISQHGISPHTMKYGKYRGQLYPYGICEVSIE